MSKCEKCVSDKTWCPACRDNPEVQKILASLPKESCFMEYKPVCPRGYVDCVWDPGYIHFYYPDWYKRLYGDLKPEIAILQAGGCLDKMRADPDEEGYCYDDEDK